MGDPEEKKSLSQSSTITLGLAIVLFGAVVSGIWWAATLSAKVDVLLTITAATQGETAKLREDFSSLKDRVLTLEKTRP